MDFKQYQAGVNSTWKQQPLVMTSWEQDVVFCETGISGESGEISELVKKGIFHQIPSFLERELVMKELGDLLYYTTKFADLFGITLEEVAEANNAKLRARYPEGFAFGGGIR